MMSDEEEANSISTTIRYSSLSTYRYCTLNSVQYRYFLEESILSVSDIT